LKPRIGCAIFEAAVLRFLRDHVETPLKSSATLKSLSNSLPLRIFILKIAQPCGLARYSRYKFSRPVEKNFAT